MRKLSLREKCTCALVFCPSPTPLGIICICLHLQRLVGDILRKVGASFVKWRRVPKQSMNILAFFCIETNIKSSLLLLTLVCLFVSCAQLLESCWTLCDPKDCSPPGSSVHGSLQARILEWVAMPSSRGSSQLKDRNCISLGAAELHLLP